MPSLYEDAELIQPQSSTTIVALEVELYVQQLPQGLSKEAQELFKIEPVFYTCHTEIIKGQTVLAKDNDNQQKGQGVRLFCSKVVEWEKE